MKWVLVGIGGYVVFVGLVLWAGAGWRRVRDQHPFPPPPEPLDRGPRDGRRPGGNGTPGSGEPPDTTRDGSG